MIDRPFRWCRTCQGAGCLLCQQERERFQALQADTGDNPQPGPVARRLGVDRMKRNRQLAIAARLYAPEDPDNPGR